MRSRPPGRGWSRWVVVPLVVVVIAITSGILHGTLGFRGPVQAQLHRVAGWVGSLRSFNRYGLFAVMTTSRPEIVIEGSNDGTTWLPYEFKWKPGDRFRRPRFATPHMPRLDWQMWFAALGDYRNNPWFTRLMLQLREGSDEVIALLENNPFPDGPPGYIRAVVYDYRFSRPEERRTSGAWWRREPLRLYHPVVAQPGSPLLGSMPKPVD